ncbi:MAG: 6-phosphofructokinase [Clostridia bacterium]|nr:6-phosphofructokinase [Clostridia bacterium]
MAHNVIVGQSGGPTAVINASLAGVFSKARELGADRIYGMINGIEGLLNGKYCDLEEKITSKEDLSVLCQTPSSFLGSCRFKLPEPEAGNEIYDKLFNILAELEIEVFVYIGGNDSMDTIKKLSKYAGLIGSTIKFMGAPKTIDNDLAVTDHTPGFGSAAKYIATVIKEIIRDSYVYNLKSVTVVEIMGRNAGWLTGASVLAKGTDCPGPDLIYLPEVPFDMDNFVAKVKKLTEEKGNVVVAVSEGVTLADGRNICEIDGEIEGLDAFGHKILSGAASFLAKYLAKNLGVKTRAIELNTPQRAASHIASLTDVQEAFMTGAFAVQGGFSGKTGEMAIICRNEGEYKSYADSFDINKIANEVKQVPIEWICEDGTYVTDEFVSYVLPLIQGEPQLIYKNGLPAHLSL